MNLSEQLAAETHTQTMLVVLITGFVSQGRYTGIAWLSFALKS